MKKIKEEVLVETYLEYNNVKYVRGMEYTVSQDNHSIEWHKIEKDGNWTIIKEKEFQNKLEKQYIKTFID
jgi:hypothetical protein